MENPRQRRLQPVVNWPLKISAWLIVWILFCWAADFVFSLGADAWRMWYGYVAGIVTGIIGDLVGNDDAH